MIVKERKRMDEWWWVGQIILPWGRIQAVELSENWRVVYVAWARKWLLVSLGPGRLRAGSRKRSTTWRQSGMWGCTCETDNNPVGVETTGSPPDKWNSLLDSTSNNIHQQLWPFFLFLFLISLSLYLFLSFFITHYTHNHVTSSDAVHRR